MPKAGLPMDKTVKNESADGFIEVTGGTLIALSRDGKPAGEPLVIGTEPRIVGRGAHCHLVIRDPAVSTSHCELVATNRGVLVKDLATTNGTYVNQVRLERAGFLIANARLRCGETWLDFRIAAPEQVPVSTADRFGRLVGRSAAMRRIYAKLASIAPHDLSVLVLGETGTGKELVAKSIHEASRRRGGPLIVVDCTTIPASLAESRLFGHEKGAFTGAVARQTSPFVDARGGTIFFDELGELPADVQPKLLRALEAREIQMLGSSRLLPIDVRVVAATRRNMHAEMNAKRFREDLYYRFAQVIIEIPPLRERPEDITDLVANFLSDFGDPGAITRIEPPTMERLQRYDWPGNVRELRNVLAVAHAQSEGGPIEVAELLSTHSAGGTRIQMTDRLAAAQTFEVAKRGVLDVFEREYFTNLSREAGGNISEMARRSGQSRPTVKTYLDRYGLRATSE